ncbi:MAG: hypothetical protein JOZ41_12700 [Chloroflexi bacterium]|nr:hypothetical protein [Chloroflexota bacterium]
MSPSGVLIRHGNGDDWHEPAIGGFPTEAALETLLSQSPFLLPWDLTEGMVLASQVSLPPAGTADLVGVGVSGEIVLVECKLRSNAEIRRHIVGQIFAYASVLWRSPFEVFADRWGAARKKPLLGCVEALAMLSGAEWNADDFRAAVSANLAAGRFRLLVAVDEMTEELQGIVEYVNHHTVPDVQLLALQLQYRRDGDVEILLPTIFGGETVQAKARSEAVHTTEEDLFSALREGCSPAGVDAVRRLYEWSAAHGMRPYWGTGQHPSLTAWFDVDGVSISPWSIWAAPRNAYVSVNFEWIAHRGYPQDRLEAFLTALERIPGVAPRVAGVRQADYRKRPGILIDDVLAKPGAMDALGRALAALLGMSWDDP